MRKLWEDVMPTARMSYVVLSERSEASSLILAAWVGRRSGVGRRIWFSVGVRRRGWRSCVPTVASEQVRAGQLSQITGR